MKARVVELFCGIGGFRIAADRMGLQTVFANDLCPKACAVYRDRFGSEVLVEGDIRKVLGDVPAHDILTGGFPCQPFSSAGKKQGTRDPRGTLFEVIVEVLRRRRPQIFVLENVKRLLSMERGSHFATILSALTDIGYVVEWRLLRATHFGLPQNRQRVILVGRQMVERNPSLVPGLLSTEDVESLSPAQRGLLMQPRLWPSLNGHRAGFPSWGIASSQHFMAAEVSGLSDAVGCPTLRSFLDKDVPPEFDFTESTLARIKKSDHVDRFVDGVHVLSNQGGGARMGYTVFGIDGLAPALTATPSRHYERYLIDGRYRRLTNTEYARLQGFPKDQCTAVSVYDQYSLYGNAVPPPMVEWALRRATARSRPLSTATVPTQQLLSL